MKIASGARENPEQYLLLLLFCPAFPWHLRLSIYQLNFTPSKESEFHRENLDIKLLEWYSLDHLVMIGFILCQNEF